MSKLEEFLSLIPDYAKDVKLNIKSITDSTKSPLTEKQTAALCLASAIATKNRKLVEIFEEYASSVLSEQETNAAKGAAIIMGMNNIYYRFLHLCSNKEYENLQTGLRMQIISNHGIEKTDFELYSIAVSAINGCGLCIDSHEKVLKHHGVKPEVIQHAVKIAGIVNSASFIL